MFQRHDSLDQRDQTRGALSVADVRLHRGDVDATFSKHLGHSSGLDGISNWRTSSVTLEVCCFGEVLGDCQSLVLPTRCDHPWIVALDMLTVIPACLDARRIIASWASALGCVIP